MSLLRTTARTVIAVIGAAAVAAVTLATPVSATTGTDEQRAAVASHSGSRDVRPIPFLDLERYQGRWLQLAAIPTDFSAVCDRDTQAEYTLLPDGLVQVLNSCVSAAGAPIEIEGRAQVVGPDSNAQLEVSFARDDSGGFVFTGTANYWVIGIDQHDYDWAVVGDGDRSSGFVLSREPRLGARDVVRVVRVLLRNGYDPCDFEITATTGGVEENRNLCHLR